LKDVGGNQLESYSLNIRKDFKNVGLKKVQFRGKMHTLHTRMLRISRNVYLSRLEQVKKDVYDFKYVSLKPVRVWDRMDTLDTRM
jgi:uncharacterized protein YhbP (UPF0306 family)